MITLSRLCSRVLIKAVLTATLIPLAGSIAASNLSYHINIKGLNDKLTSKALSSLTSEQTIKLTNPVQLRILASQNKHTLNTFMQTQGYFHADIEVLIDHTTNWQIEYRVHSGPATHITDCQIKVEGSGKHNPALQKIIINSRLKAGRRFVQQRYTNLKNKLLSTAIGQGYLNAKLTQHTVYINRAQNQAHIVITLQTGTRYHIASTRFIQSGFRFSPTFLQRFIPYQPHSIYQYSKQTELQQNLESSNYFDIIDVHNHRDDKTQKVAITANLSAKKSQQYTFGIGYGTETGPRALLGWKLRHITASGQKLTARMEISKLYVNFGVSYIFPGKNPLTDYTSLNAGQSYTNITPYTALETAVGINWTRQTGHWHWNLGLHQNFVRYSLQVDQDHFARYLIPNFFFVYQNYQQRGYWPTGFSWRNDLSGTVQNPLSSQSFLRDTSNLFISYSLSHNNRLTSRLAAGALATHDLDSISPTLRYYAGGVNNVRGYAFKSLSPSKGGALTGGHYMFLASIGLEHRFIGNWSGLVFYNVGNAFNQFSHVDGAQGAGLGVSWRSPMGPIQLFLSHPLFYRSQHSWRLDFNIGMSF